MLFSVHLFYVDLNNETKIQTEEGSMDVGGSHGKFYIESPTVILGV